MARKKIKIISIFLFVFFIYLSSYAAVPSVDNIIEIGKSYYFQGYYDLAIEQFNDALRINPGNLVAQEYIKRIENKNVPKKIDDFLEDVSAQYDRQQLESQPVLPKIDEALPAEIVQPASDNYTNEQQGLMDRMKQIQPTQTQKNMPMPPAENKTVFLDSAKPNKDISEQKEDDGEVKVSGSAQISVMFESDGDIEWQRSNWDLNELDWRLTSNNGWDNRTNTFDPAVYDRFQFEVDKSPEVGLGFHTNIDISPWSFVGKTDKVTVSNSLWGTDTVDIQLKYWANTGRVLNEIYYTNLLGDSISIVEGRVHDGELDAFNAASGWGNVFYIPGLEIHEEFWPLREMWFDFKTENASLRVFPAGLQDQAYTSDDILGLSNHAIYWEESPWLSAWKPGIYNSDFGGGAGAFTKGSWDDDLAWLIRDSDGVRLTNLRGITASLGLDYTTLDFSASSPKTLWDDYDDFDTINSAVRIKHLIDDNLQIAATGAGKFGLNKSNLDATNSVYGVDVTYGVDDNSKVAVEVAKSHTIIDRTSDYKTDKRGNAVKASFLYSSDGDVFNNNYFGLRPEEDSNIPLFKMGLDATHMDKGFESVLSNYRETRDDMFWSRHIHFGEPFKYHYVGLYEPTLTWDDVEPFRIGDGIDYGRDVLRLRLQGYNYLAGKMDWLFDTRHIHLTNGKYLETVSRLESEYRLTSKFTAKFLGLYYDRPKTVGGVDPYIVDAQTGDFYTNSAIEDGKNADLSTLSVGGEYKFTNRFSMWGTYEWTNDSTVAYDNFPRSLLRGGSVSSFTEDGDTFLQTANWLNSQGLYPLPPYDYFDVFKAGLNYRLTDTVGIGVDYTRNEFRGAGQIDNNMNHIGFELTYDPNENLTWYFKYVYSLWNDIDRMVDGETDIYNSHHNFFAELSYRPSEVDEFLCQYGVYTKGAVGELIFDPYGGTSEVLDTQQVVRLYYKRKF